MSALTIASYYMQKAERALVAAQLLLGQGATEGACNRAYYAMFDAANAALIATGHQPERGAFKSHGGLISEFSQRLVQSGKIDAAFGRALNRVQDIRLKADYSAEAPPHEEAAWAVEQALAFVAAVREKFASP